MIGPGGKIIRAIVEETGAKIDIEDDGTVLIASIDGEAGRCGPAASRRLSKSRKWARCTTASSAALTDFGAFVEIMPGTDGLVHISELDVNRVNRVEDVCKVGDRMEVKVID